ncbi:rhodanese-like domain-containing protein [Lentibacillus salicampi]|uniref:Rhodanese-like domain-containing protein n=1 Tax=Lentibacillus salicampi TaxID=175306 RepID=A0A4Y9ABQ2_9BACI|nr:rhodanese-like domain-containing protein [Lentibacillus salicampi]TFJ93243.1 rhodanese-like domain-containing protein [Lentibacillus salicampi]
MKKITTGELAEKIKQGENVRVIDVREDEEVEQGKIPGAEHIPLGEVPERLDEMDKRKHYYMVCRSGGRSGKVTEFLENQGFDVTNVEGGMLAWDEDVEK